MSYEIEELNENGNDSRDAVYTMLREHNHQSNGEFWESLSQEENQRSPIELIAYDETREVVGGLFGSTQFQWLKVDVMAVIKASRETGIGSALLEAAEAIARERGCRRVYVDTMSYQAPEFYKKVGYTVVGELEDWDTTGHSKFFLVKSL